MSAHTIYVKDEGEWSAFAQAAQHQRRSVSDLLMELITRYLAGLNGEDPQ